MEREDYASLPITVTASVGRPPDELDFYLQGVTGIVTSLRSRNAELEHQLQAERQSSQSKYNESNKQWERDKRDLHILKYSERRVVCLIDGDGTLFSPSFLSKGTEGGRLAARTLADKIREYLREQDFVFEAPFDIAKYIADRQLLDDFLVGFNQAGERFLMVDVGPGKENADAKLRAFLTDHARSPYTLRIFLGLSHDNGYVPALNEIISNGNRHKLILLPGYSEIAIGIQELGLPELVVPDLFLLEKIPSIVSRFNTPRKPGHRSLPSNDGLGLRTSPPNAITADTFSESDVPLDQLSTFPPISSSRAASFSGNRPPRSSIIHFGSVPGSPVSPNNDTLTSPPRNFPKTACYLHYLLGKCSNPQCRYSHVLELSSDELASMRTYARSTPCQYARGGRRCAFGERCIWGHKCPLGASCPNQAECLFTGLNMHA